MTQYKMHTEYPDYRISNDGKILDVNRNCLVKLSTKKGTSPHRYCRLRHDDGGWKSPNVHRLVAELFIGPIPNGHCVVFKDENYDNLNADNLEIVTLSERAQRNWFDPNRKPRGSSLV